MIEFDQGEIIRLLLRSLLCGVALGVFYDGIRLIKLFCGVRYGEREEKKNAALSAAHFILAFVTDIVFWVTVGVVSVALIYGSTGGIFRGSTYLCLAVGFVAYYFTLGRAVLFLSRRLVKLCRRAARRMIKVAAVPLSFIFKGIISLYHLTIGKIIGKIKERIRTRKNKPNDESEQECFALSDGRKEDFVYVDGKTGYRRTDRINFGSSRRGN
jgi:hypothetical protein